jgi:hypothetical protein
MADGNPVSGQRSDHPAAAAAVILLVESIDPGHDPQRLDLHRFCLVVERGTRQAHQGALAADAELRVVIIDECAQFTGY